MARPKGRRLEKRFSVSLDPVIYARLERLAAERDVALAWVARRAIAEFVEREAGDQAELPLIRREAPQAERP
jgi:predicted transcriptional regulator